MSNDPRGTIIRQGNLLRINNALVEEASCLNASNGYIILSYSAPAANQMVTIQTIRLNVGRNTVILNSSGQNLSLCRIRKGMWVNAVFSSRMTRSIPPQANAYLIVVRRAAQSPNLPSAVTTDRIVSVDTRGGFLTTGNPFNPNRQTRFVMSNATPVTDQLGRSVGIRALRPGQLVRITHANFQTASIPPQTTAYRIQILSHA